jgi:PhnB protein
MAVYYKAKGFHTVTPYLVVDDIPKEVKFLQKAFGAEVGEQLTLPDGTVNHAMVSIGDSVVMLGAGRGEWKPSAAMLYVYVEDTDAVYRATLAAGATSLMEPSNQFYGDRNAGVRDPHGVSWWIATHIEDVPHDELVKRNLAQAKGDR